MSWVAILVFFVLSDNSLTIQNMSCLLYILVTFNIAFLVCRILNRSGMQYVVTFLISYNHCHIFWLLKRCVISPYNTLCIHICHHEECFQLLHKHVHQLCYVSPFVKRWNERPISDHYLFLHLALETIYDILEANTLTDH